MWTLLYVSKLNIKNQENIHSQKDGILKDCKKQMSKKKKKTPKKSNNYSERITWIFLVCDQYDNDSKNKIPLI